MTVYPLTMPVIDITQNKVRLDGKVIGILNEHGCLIMKRNFAKHHYHVLDAWCINESVFNYGFKKFQINTDEKVYKISLEKVKAIKSRMNMWVTYNKKKSVEDDSERQLAIPVICWDIYSLGNVEYPSHIGISASEFFDNPTPIRWQSRKITSMSEFQPDIFE